MLVSSSKRGLEQVYVLRSAVEWLTLSPLDRGVRLTTPSYALARQPPGRLVLRTIVGIDTLPGRVVAKVPRRSTILGPWRDSILKG